MTLVGKPLRWHFNHMGKFITRAHVSFWFPDKNKKTTHSTKVPTKVPSTNRHAYSPLGKASHFQVGTVFAASGHIEAPVHAIRRGCGVIAGGEAHAARGAGPRLAQSERARRGVNDPRPGMGHGTHGGRKRRRKDNHFPQRSFLQQQEQKKKRKNNSSSGDLVCWQKRRLLRTRLLLQRVRLCCTDSDESLIRNSPMPDGPWTGPPPMIPLILQKWSLTGTFSLLPIFGLGEKPITTRNPPTIPTFGISQGECTS